MAPEANNMSGVKKNKCYWGRTAPKLRGGNYFFREGSSNCVWGLIGKVLWLLGQEGGSSISDNVKGI